MVQDYLTVYDGGSKDSPVLVRMCGGDAVPEIVSSGPRMLLEFHTSPFDSPFHPAPLSYLPGFELEVQVSSRSSSTSPSQLTDFFSAARLIRVQQSPISLETPSNFRVSALSYVVSRKGRTFVALKEIFFKADFTASG